MPDLNQFLNKKKADLKLNDRDLEQLNGIRPCSHCSEDVVGALWDAIDLTMYWKCNNGHENSFKIN
jgi:hypothetical protein